MTNEEMKKAIEQYIGVPAALLAGETIEENIALAKAALAMRREYAASRPQQKKTNREQFEDWVHGQIDVKQPDQEFESLNELEQLAMQSGAIYPRISDGGEASVNTGSNDSTLDQFRQFAYDKLAFDPFR